MTSVFEEGAVRACRVCGCTEVTACVDKSGPCAWVGPDLCSACPAVPVRWEYDRPNDFWHLRLGQITLLTMMGRRPDRPTQLGQRQWSVSWRNTFWMGVNTEDIGVFSQADARRYVGGRIADWLLRAGLGGGS